MLETGKNIRIVFMGTPDFAVASLDALVTAGFRVVGVITAPDKPAGRGMRLTASAVKKYAVEKNLKVLQPEKLKDPFFLNELRSLRADVQVVVAFRMLPEVVWNMPPLGTINVHGSLLPQYRGAAPIHWAVINGEKQTGVTTFKLKHAIDTGDILLQKSFPVGEDETTGEVHDRMKMIGAQLLVETMNGLADQTLSEIAQPLPGEAMEILRHAPKIFTKDCVVNWEATTQKVYDLVRGLSPFPGALTELDGKTLKIFRGLKEFSDHSEVPGKILSDGKTFLKFACSDGYLHITDLQLEGKRRMPVEEFLRGYRLS